MHLIQLLKFKTRLFKMPRLKIPRFKMRTRVTFAPGHRISTRFRPLESKGTQGLVRERCPVPKRCAAALWRLLQN